MILFKRGEELDVITYHKTIDGKIVKINGYESGCWVNCVAPTEMEINYLMSSLGVEPEFLKASLDEEESSRIDKEEDNTLIIIDSPVVDRTGKNFTYYTNPVSIIITPQNIVTISVKENSVIEEFSASLIRFAYPENKIRFSIQIMARIASKYLQYINQIIKITGHVEEELKETMRNEDLVQLLEIKKSLVYFSASIKAISSVIGKMSRKRHFSLNEEDAELLEDVAIEMRQAAEMSEIYMNILSSSMEAYSSLISNNLNVVMKILASITLILSIPTIVSGIYGMNNPGIPFMDRWEIPFILMGVAIVITWAVLKKKDML